MLVQGQIKSEMDLFNQVDRPGVQLAKDFYALIRENFNIIDQNGSGCISAKEISEYNGNQKLKKFLDDNGCYLNKLAFKADNLIEILFECTRQEELAASISLADLKTFSYLSKDINRKIFFEDNFQVVRASAGMSASFFAFILGLLAAASILISIFSGACLHLNQAELALVSTSVAVGVPLLFSILGYFFGVIKADCYFSTRIKRIDSILKNIETAR